MRLRTEISVTQTYTTPIVTSSYHTQYLFSSSSTYGNLSCKQQTQLSHQKTITQTTPLFQINFPKNPYRQCSLKRPCQVDSEKQKFQVSTLWGLYHHTHERGFLILFIYLCLAKDSSFLFISHIHLDGSCATSMQKR